MGASESLDYSYVAVSVSVYLQGGIFLDFESHGQLRCCLLHRHLGFVAFLWLFVFFSHQLRMALALTTATWWDGVSTDSVWGGVLCLRFFRCFSYLKWPQTESICWFKVKCSMLFTYSQCHAIAKQYHHKMHLVAVLELSFISHALPWADFTSSLPSCQFLRIIEVHISLFSTTSRTSRPPWLISWEQFCLHTHFNP